MPVGKRDALCLSLQGSGQRCEGAAVRSERATAGRLVEVTVSPACPTAPMRRHLTAAGARVEMEILPDGGAGPATQADLAAGQAKGFRDVQERACCLRCPVRRRGEWQVADEFQGLWRHLDPPVLEWAAVAEVLDGG